MQGAKNARFWVWYNGSWVKLTLKPEQCLTHTIGGQTDEGFNYCQSTWLHEFRCSMPYVTWCEETWGRDCDGRYDSGSLNGCHVDQLKAFDQYAEFPDPANVGIMRPAWTCWGSNQRDHTAETANY